MIMKYNYRTFASTDRKMCKFKRNGRNSSIASYLREYIYRKGYTCWQETDDDGVSRASRRNSETVILQIIEICSVIVNDIFINIISI